MSYPALEQTECGRCGGPLRKTSEGVTCACEQPMYGGMVQVGADGFAACYGCGWRGLPTYVRGKWSTHCPSCEGFGDEPDLREHGLAYDIHIRRDGVYRMEDGHLVSCSAPKPRAPKVGRNDPCPCGSGKKFKKCHGA